MASTTTSSGSGWRVKDLWKDPARAGKGRRWLGQAYDPHRRKYKSRAFPERLILPGGREQKGQVAARTWAKDEHARLAAGLTTSATADLRKIGDDFIEHLKDHGRSDDHRGQVAIVVADLVRLGARDMADDSFPGIVERYLAGLRDGRRKPKAKPGERPPPAPKVSASTRNRKLRIIRSVIRYAQKRRVLRFDPLAHLEAKRVPKVYKATFTIAELRHVLSDAQRYKDHGRREEMERLVERHGSAKAAAEALGIAPSTFHHRRRSLSGEDPWWTFFAVGAYTGMRSEEIRSLTWGMIDWDADVIRLPAEITKAQRDRRIPLQPELRAILKPRAGVGAALVMPEAITDTHRTMVTKSFQRFLRRCGVDAEGRGPHALRHTVAALLTATGVSPLLAMDYLGHASAGMTKHYSESARDYVDAVKGWEPGVFRLRVEQEAETAAAGG